MQQNWQNEREEKREIQDENVTKEKKEKNSWLKLIDTRIVALFVLGVLVGVTLKTHALKTVTMGFDDYKLSNSRHDFNLSRTDSAQEEQDNEEELPEEAEIEDEI